MNSSRMGLLFSLCLLMCALALAVPGMRAGDDEAFVNNERAAVGVTRTLNTALVTYHHNYEIGYPHSLGVLGGPRDGESEGPWAANFVAAPLDRGIWKDYKFVYRPGPEDSEGRIATYTVTARPVKYGETAKLSVFTDESGVIRGTRENREATVNDPPLPPLQ